MNGFVAPEGAAIGELVGEGGRVRVQHRDPVVEHAALQEHVTEAVANRLKRPDDATEVTVQHDDTQVSRRYESSTGQIEILDQWWALLFPATAGAGGAFTIPLHYHRHGSGHHHHAGLHDAW